MLYAGFRIGYFHPACNLPYCRWLRTTPWTSSKPLPLGPIHLVLQDGVVVLVMALLAYLQPDLNPLHLIAFFLGVYLALLALTFRWTGQWACAYAVAFGLGLVVRLWHHPWAAAAAAVLVYPLAYTGLRHSLANFPSWQEEIGRSLSGQQAGNPPRDTLGWPFDRLQPKPPTWTKGISTRDAVLVSLLAGWWLYAVGSLPTDPGLRLGIVETVHFGVIGLLTLGRLVAYCAGARPPIGVWGRLWTLRWIIPGYDKIFIAPLSVVLIAVLFPHLSARHGIEPEIGFPCSLCLALLAVWNIGPSLLNWHLTGRHRLVPGTAVQQRSIRVG
jgi:hypothetical protein